MLALALFMLLAAAGAEPGLEETQQAAAHRAAGDTADDASRTVRARRAHWAPVLHAQLGFKQDDKARRGVFRSAPLIEDDTGDGRAFGVVLQWDLAQVIYAREESALALAHAHLARLRSEAMAQAAKLWTQRRLKRLSLPSGAPRLAAALELLNLTAELDALTGGLFHDALAREEAECASLSGEPKP
jgi:hypothetical protein